LIPTRAARMSHSAAEDSEMLRQAMRRPVPLAAMLVCALFLLGVVK
jgi:hypothetical protein